jgi:hypothetical protein
MSIPTTRIASNDRGVVMSQCAVCGSRFAYPHSTIWHLVLDEPELPEVYLCQPHSDYTAPGATVPGSKRLGLCLEGLHFGPGHVPCIRHRSKFDPIST